MNMAIDDVTTTARRRTGNVFSPLTTAATSPPYRPFHVAFATVVVIMGD
jgi:hypothetical protein